MVCGGGSKNRTRNFSGGQPCNGTSTDSQICTGEHTYQLIILNLGNDYICLCSTESEPICQNPILCISYEEHGHSSHNSYYRGENVFTNSAPVSSGIPEDPEDYWGGKVDIFPQKIRIGFSCPKTISSVKMRNSIHQKSVNTKMFEVKVREPNSTLWVSFINGTMPNTFGQDVSTHVNIFTGTAITAMEVEFSCLSAYANGGSNKRCALNYIEFN